MAYLFILFVIFHMLISTLAQTGVTESSEKPCGKDHHVCCSNMKGTLEKKWVCVDCKLEFDDELDET